MPHAQPRGDPRFLVVEAIDERTERPLTVVLVWQALLRR